MEGAPVRRALWTPVLAGLALLLAGLAAAQKPLHKDLPLNDPRQCPYCEGDPERMAAAGIVSHGGFPVGKGTTATVDEQLAGFDVFWIETAHHAIGLEVAPYKVPAKERDRFERDLAELRVALPAIPEKIRSLDPWLRGHLYAHRVEKLYAWMQETLEVTDEVFPQRTDGKFDPAQGYFGMGPFLGMARKYEVLVMTSQASCSQWLLENYGIKTKFAQRWHEAERGALMLVTHLGEGGRRVDEALHAHLTYNLVQNYLNGYKHYSYDKPVWMLQGLAHWAERQVSRRYNNFDSGEGSAGERTTKENWEPPTRKLVAGEKAPSLGALIRMRSTGEMDLERHFVTWSMFDYLQRQHPGAVGKLLNAVSGLMTAEYMPDGGRVGEATREAFREHLGMTTVAFEQRWRAWVLETYSTR